jgi:hypothetical protein
MREAATEALFVLNDAFKRVIASGPPRATAPSCSRRSRWAISIARGGGEEENEISVQNKFQNVSLADKDLTT